MVCIFVLLLSFLSLSLSASLGGELGDEINWRSYEEGINEIRETKKPGLIIFHRDKSNSCVRLGNEMRGYKQLIKRSEKFVMISCNGENDPQTDVFDYDGSYVPKIFFIYPNNTISWTTVSSPLNYHYRYYYRSAKQLNERMRDFLKAIKKDHMESEL